MSPTRNIEAEHRHPEPEAEADREDDAEICAPHHERALGEIDHVQDRERDREPDGDEGVQAAQRERVDRLLEEHGAMVPNLSARAQPAAGARRPRARAPRPTLLC